MGRTHLLRQADATDATRLGHPRAAQPNPMRPRVVL